MVFTEMPASIREKQPSEHFLSFFSFENQRNPYVGKGKVDIRPKKISLFW